MTIYALGTKVEPEKTRADIEHTLRRYGADGFLYGEIDGRAMIGFRMNGRHVKFLLPIGDVSAAVMRQKWRALFLVIKAKLESVESGIETFEESFMANIVLPDGQLIGDVMKPQIEDAYQSGQMPPLLPHYGGH